MKKKILFLCTGNSCRSQMAEGWTNHLMPDLAQAWSAGVKPGTLDPLAVKAMAEKDVDISTHKSKHVDSLSKIIFDLVITVCDNAKETCPNFTGKTKVMHRGFDDPPKLAEKSASEEETLVHYRRVRDEIRDVVIELKTSRELV